MRGQFSVNRWLSLLPCPAGGDRLPPAPAQACLLSPPAEHLLRSPAEQQRGPAARGGHQCYVLRTGGGRHQGGSGAVQQPSGGLHP